MLLFVLTTVAMGNIEIHWNVNACVYEWMVAVLAVDALKIGFFDKDALLLLLFKSLILYVLWNALF